MQPAQRRVEFPHHVAEWRFQRCPPPNQNIIVAGKKRRAKFRPRHEADDLTQTAPDAVSFHRIADLARHGKTDPGRAGRRTRARLEHKAAGRRPRAFGGSLKVRPAFQPFHATDFKPSLKSNWQPTRPNERSRAQFFAPLRAPRSQDLAAALGRHAGAKAVTALAHQFARLIGPFHGMLQWQYWRGLYGTPPGPSNAIE
jgi:hypothetical protein